MGFKGALANLICIFCWTAPLLFLPASIVLIAAPHGFIGVCAGFVLMGALLGGPMNVWYRLALYACYLAVGIADGSCHSLLGCGMLALMLLMITERPGGPKAWPPSPWFCTLITERLDGASYYATCELRGDLHKISPGRTLYAQHPHGILTAGFTWTMFWNFAFHERTGRIGFLLDEGLRLKSPTFRLMCDWFEGPKRWAGAATKGVIKAAMAKGESLAIIPGGFQEATICAYGADRVYIKRRQVMRWPCSPSLQASSHPLSNPLTRSTHPVLHIRLPPSPGLHQVRAAGGLHRRPLLHVWRYDTSV